LRAEEGEMTFLRDMYDAENYIAERLRSLTSIRYYDDEDAGRRIDRFQERTGIEYEPQQRAAITAAMASGAVVITGGPGTGKTTTVNAILALCEERGDRVALCAPTGRAAKRMTELTGKEARTIHRLLEVGYGSRENIRFIHNEENPLKFDVVIIDEMSMVDSQLFCSLLKGIKPWCRLVMVGDDHQLPSVGAGNVLKDILASGICETIELEKIFRQAAESLIVVNAHAIVEGSAPDLKRRDKDFFFLDTEKEDMPDLITDLVYRRLPKSYGLDPLDDIQVITPSRLGLSGTGTLNDSLRDRLNPATENKREIKVGSLTVREGDKVMQTRNNYDIEWTKDDGEEGVGVFNGDIGIVDRVDVREGIISIRFDDRVARYDLDQARQLEEAYAITVHKSQGSEFPAVILAVGDTPRKLCYRNLLYTAVTRARSLLIIAGNEDLISLMVNNDRKMFRYTGLMYMLRSTD
ncbi:MAG: AAA family ATPase, partial [Oscillospiraceae bacterium]|nr:AAA family ATPase [Oscillospiraceae bacterium]